MTIARDFPNPKLCTAWVENLIWPCLNLVMIRLAFCDDHDIGSNQFKHFGECWYGKRILPLTKSIQSGKSRSQKKQQGPNIGWFSQSENLLHIWEGWGGWMNFLLRPAFSQLHAKTLRFRFSILTLDRTIWRRLKQQWVGRC